MTYSRAARTTIGPGCLTAVFGMGTGVAIRVCPPGRRSLYASGSGKGLFSLHFPRGGPGQWVPGPGVNAVKRSAVSTGQLRRLPALHTRPIDPVVSREPSALRPGGLVLGWVSRLDAFSVYPGRT